MKKFIPIILLISILLSCDGDKITKENIDDNSELIGSWESQIIKLIYINTLTNDTIGLYEDTTVFLENGHSISSGFTVGLGILNIMKGNQYEEFSKNPKDWWIKGSWTLIDNVLTLIPKKVSHKEINLKLSYDVKVKDSNHLELYNDFYGGYSFYNLSWKAVHVSTYERK